MKSHPETRGKQPQMIGRRRPNLPITEPRGMAAIVWPANNKLPVGGRKRIRAIMLKHYVVTPPPLSKDYLKAHDFLKVFLLF